MTELPPDLIEYFLQVSPLMGLTWENIEEIVEDWIKQPFVSERLPVNVVRPQVPTDFNMDPVAAVILLGRLYALGYAVVKVGPT